MPDPTIDQIRQRMVRIRARAHNKANRLGEETRQFLDWRHYLRLFPWSILAAATVAGYLLVPRKPSISGQTADALVELAQEQRIQAAAPPADPPASVFQTVLGIAGQTLLRAGLALAVQQAVKLASQTAGTKFETHEEPDHALV